MTYLHFGNLTIPTVWIAVLITLFITALFFRVLFGKNPGDWYWNGFFLFFLVWKLSYILFHFKLFIDMPLSIVYFNGGTKGHILALAVLAFYLLFIRAKKDPSIYEESVYIFLLNFICYEAGINIIEKRFVEALCHFIVLAGFFVVLAFMKKKKIIFSSQMLIAIMMLELLIISFFRTLLSIETLTFSMIGIIVLILSKMKKKEQKT